MALTSTDLFLVNRGGTDYKLSYDKIMADIDGNITIGDGTITLKSFDGAKVGEFTTNQAGDATITLPQVVIPESLHPKGFINVQDPAPANPEHGDIYVQHDALNPVDKTADASFVGLAGQVIAEGVFVVFGVDDKWHAGGQANQIQTQADWAETDQTEASFIKNKPGIPQPNDGAIKIEAGNGIIATGDNASSDQAGDTTRTISAKVAGGLTINGDGSIIIDPAFDLNGNVTAPNDGTLTIQDFEGNNVWTFTADQASDTSVTLPKGFSGDYDDLTNKPAIGNGELTLTDPTGNTKIKFSANQAGNQEASVYLKDSYIQNLPTLS